MAIDDGHAAGSAYEVLPRQSQPSPARASASEPVASIGGVTWLQRALFRRVPVQHLVNFSRQFASYLDAGINLYRAMESLRRQYEPMALGPVIGRLQLAVRRGESLTDAMSREPGAFDHFFLSMMRVAEVRGSVPETLRMLSVQYDARQRMRRQTKSALIYPAFVILMSVTVSLLLTIFVLPPLVDVMRGVILERKVELPLLTQYLIQPSDVIVAWGWWAFPLTLFGGVAFVAIAYRSPRGKAVLDVVLMHLPVIGQLVQKIDTTRFCRTLSTLLDSGVDIGSSLELTADTLLLAPVRHAVLRARDSVTVGETLSNSIELTNRFPADIVALMSSGEETGRLPEMLYMVADQYEEQVEFIVKNLGNLLQPVITILVGGVVFFIAVAFFMGYASILTTLGQR
jgi:type II secretory pathway component PulF